MTTTLTAQTPLDAVRDALAREPRLRTERFTPEDVTTALHTAASEYAETYHGSFGFMQEMQAAALTRRGLTLGQAKGVLNCMRAEALRTEQRAAEQAARAANPAADLLGPEALAPGLYIVTLADGARVNLRLKALEPEKCARYDVPVGTLKYGVYGYGDTDTSAIWLGLVSENRIARRWRVRYEEIPTGYQARVRAGTAQAEPALRVLAARATAQEVAGRAFAEEAGACYKCGKALTDELSRSRAIGPDCYARLQRAA